MGKATTQAEKPEFTARRQAADAMAEAAQAWLAGLDPGQRTVACGPAPTDADSDTERRRWFYTPTDHGGLTLNQQRSAQQRAAMRLVASGLSTAGYVTVALTMGLENVLDQTEGFVARFDRERGRDPGMYYLGSSANQEDRDAWGWRFGGHHVSLNYLIADGVVVSTTPCFIGADPASSPLLGEMRAPAARPRGGSGARTCQLSPPPASGPRRSPAEGTPRSRHGQPQQGLRGRPRDPADRIWRARRFLDPAEQERLEP